MTTTVTSTTPVTGPRSGEEVLQRVLAAFGAGDMEEVARWFRPDVVVQQADSLPYGGEHKGQDQFRGMLGKIGQTFDLQTHAYQICDAGDVAVLRLDLTFTARSTGRSARVPSVELYTFSAGLIGSVEVFYRDTKAVVELLDT